MSTARRGPRSDAMRNHAEIVRVARTRFREYGMSTSLEAIAKQAGVGPATLYRHFATRDELIAAVLAVRDDDLAARIEQIDSLAEPAEALLSWRRALEHYFCGYGGFVGPFGQVLDAGPSSIADVCQWLVSTSARYLRAAQEAGAARVDLRGEDVYLAALSTAWASQIASTDAEAIQALRSTLDRGIGTREA